MEHVKGGRKFRNQFRESRKYLSKKLQTICQLTSLLENVQQFFVIIIWLRIAIVMPESWITTGHIDDKCCTATAQQTDLAFSDVLTSYTHRRDARLSSSTCFLLPVRGWPSAIVVPLLWRMCCFTGGKSRVKRITFAEKEDGATKRGI